MLLIFLSCMFYTDAFFHQTICRYFLCCIGVSAGNGFYAGYYGCHVLPRLGCFLTLCRKPGLLFYYFFYCRQGVELQDQGDAPQGKHVPRDDGVYANAMLQEDVAVTQHNQNHSRQCKLGHLLPPGVCGFLFFLKMTLDSFFQTQQPGAIFQSYGSIPFPVDTWG